MNIRKHIIRLLFVLTLTAMLVTAASAAQDNDPALVDGFYKYTVANGEATIVGYIYNLLPQGLESLVIPDTLGGYPVTRIGEDALCISIGLKSLEVPASVEVIEANAFSACYDLKTIILHEGLKEIGEGAFYTVPHADEVMPRVWIPNSVTFIDEFAFEGRRLTGKAFSAAELYALNCNGDFVASEEDATYRKVVQDNIVYWLHDGEATLATLQGYVATALILPEEVEGCPLTYIAPFSVRGRSEISTIVIPGTVREIGNSAFQYCSNIESIFLAEGVESIGSEAFDMTMCPKALVLPRSIKSIGENIFYFDYRHDGKNYQIVYAYSDSVAMKYAQQHRYNTVCRDNADGSETGVYLNLMYTLKNGEVTLTGTHRNYPSEIPAYIMDCPVTSIGVHGLAYNSTFNKYLIIPDTVTSIGMGAFAGITDYSKKPLDYIYIPASVTSAPDDIFECVLAYSPTLIIGEPGSFIEQYCREHGFPFQTIYEAMEIPFTDVVPGKWYYGPVSFAYHNQLMSGMTSTSFEPKRPLTRGMLVTVLWRMCGEEEVTPNHQFQDLRKNSYYEKAVNWAAFYGIVQGIDDTTFAPEQNVTRQQAAAIFYRLTQYLGVKDFPSADLQFFQDADQISNYAKAPMSWAVATGLLQGRGDHQLAPNGTATRAEIAAILMRYALYLDTLN